MKRLTLLLPLLALFLFVGRRALADLGTTAANKAACCQLTSSLVKDQLDGPDLSGDERFFMRPGLPPNIHFLFDNSGSMGDVPQDTAGSGSQWNNNPNHTCNFTELETYKTAHNWDSTGATTYPAPDPGTGFGSTDAVGKWNNMFLWDTTDPSNKEFVFLYGDDQGNTGHAYGDHLVTSFTANSSTIYKTPSTVCNAVESTTARRTSCNTCLSKKGYYKDGNGKIWMTANFLRFDPPKFVGASAVLKKVVSKLNNVRVGFTTFFTAGNGSGNGETGGVFRQEQTPACSANPLGGQTSSTIGAFVDTINGLHFNTNTPLGETLFNIGEHFSNQYQTWFGSTAWSSGGYWASTFAPTSDNQCWSCETTSVVIVTDGMPTSDSQVPLTSTGGTKTIKQLNGNNLISCPGSSGGGCGGGFGYTNLDDVAYFLHHTDLRSDLTGNQSLNVYGIGFGFRNALLQNAADSAVGGGFYVPADDSQELETAIASIVNTIRDTATTYAAASVSSLQVNQTGGSLLPRMRPSVQGRSAPWPGFLYRFGLTSESLLSGGCDPQTAATLLDGGTGDPNDLNRDGQCDTVLLDKNGAAVRENAEGDFVLVSNPSTPAQPFWEASQTFAALADAGTPAWQQRKIFTVVDTNGDGRIDWKDTPVSFDDSDAGVAALKPYLGIGANAGPICDQLSQMRGTGTGGLTADQCAKVVIDWYRGADTLNTDPTRWGADQTTADGGVLILRDIFHSAPVDVEPPTSKAFCAFTDQCTETLFKTKTPLAASTSSDGGDAYDQFFSTKGHRDRIALVGSNGGMLHAFDDGQYVSTDPVTGIPTYSDGTGRELWAFIPPDLLPKLLPYTGKHGFFVDDSPMVRDVWIDLNGDGIKQANEFRTVTVVGEGRGGVHHFALDVTDLIPTGGASAFDAGVLTTAFAGNTAATTEQGGTSPFLWLWPQPCDGESLTVGESFSNYAPRPPPIGAVALASATDGGVVVNGQNAKEDWIVFMNGGYDAYLSRGRGLAMVDIGSGKTLWSKFFGDGTPRANQMRYPFAAGVAMMDIDQGSGVASTDGLFDTATVPDYGGNVWTVRFWNPGQLDANGHVTNWVAARAFAAQPSSSTDQVVEPFTQMTANALDPQTGNIRTFLGSGDRYHLTDSSGPHCRLSNPYACAERGCSVTETVTISRGGVLDGGVSSEIGNAVYASSNYSSSNLDAGTTGANMCVGAEGRLTWSLPDSGTCGVGTAASGAVDYRCGNTADGGWACVAANTGWIDTDIVDIVPDGGSSPTASFYGFVSYGSSRNFDDADGGATYEASLLRPANLIDVTDAGVASNGTITGASATVTDNGWRLRFTASDERTATGTAVVDGCVLWNTFAPNNSGGVCSSSTASNTATIYQAGFVSGAPNCASAFNTGGTWARSISRSVGAAPGEPAVQRSIINGKSSSSIITLEPGRAQGYGVSSPNDSLRTVYQLEVNKQQHTCRHEGGSCE